jgi:hypothetical protein
MANSSSVVSVSSDLPIESRLIYPRHSLHPNQNQHGGVELVPPGADFVNLHFVRIIFYNF